MRGGLAGRGPRGGLSGKDTVETAVPIEAFRFNSPSGALANMVGSAGLKANPGTQFYCAGYRQHFYDAASTALLQSCGSSTFQRYSTEAVPNQGISNWVYAVPEYFPRACRITRLATKCFGGAEHVDNVFRLGVYDDAGVGAHFPLNLQVDSGLMQFITPTAAVAGMRVATVDVSVRAGSLLWFVMTAHGQCNTSLPTCVAMKAMCAMPLLGCTWNTTDGNGWQLEGNTDDMGGWGIGWRVARPFAALPTVFPEAGAVRLNINQADGNTSRIPGVLYTIAGLTA